MPRDSLLLWVSVFLLLGGCSAPERRLSSTDRLSLPGIDLEPVVLEDLLSEVKVGYMANDVGLMTPTDEGGQNANLQLDFATEEAFLELFFSPRPHLGVSVNNAGGTDQAYAGLTWEVGLFEDLYGQLTFGASVHDGELVGVAYEDKSLGSRFLFRESVELGYRLGRHYTVSLMLDHVSNAGLGKANEGLDTLGLRIGYRF